LAARQWGCGTLFIKRFLSREQRGEAAFIFIGGIQPRKVQVDDNPRTCPACGLPSARLKRLDHYLSLFFIPLVPVKRGQRFLECTRCGGVFDEAGRVQARPGGQSAPRRCPSCGREAAPEHRYCPFCGQRL